MGFARPLTLTVILLAAGGGQTWGQGVTVGEAGEPAFGIHGFVSTTLFAQDRSFGFGNGQNAVWASYHDATDDPWILGGDVRNTRLALDLHGVPLGSGWHASGTMEIDFFGGFNGTGPFSDEQPHLRLRIGMVELEKGSTTVGLGQAFSLLLGAVPVSLSHMTFPMGYSSAGVIGWRHPGIFLSRRLGRADGLRARIRLAALKGSWSGPGDNLEQESAGETAGFPQMEGRVDLAGGGGDGWEWRAYGVAHVDRKDLSGTEPPNGERDELTGWAFEGGGKIRMGPVTLHGNAYRGRALGQQVAHMTQFGDIGSWGGWAQVGYALSPRWSVWLFSGTEDPRDADLAHESFPVRLGNTTRAALLRFKEGPFSVGVEWMGVETEWGEGGRSRGMRRGNQISLSAMFAF